MFNSSSAIVFTILTSPICPQEALTLLKCHNSYNTYADIHNQNGRVYQNHGYHTANPVALRMLFIAYYRVMSSHVNGISGQKWQGTDSPDLVLDQSF